MRSLAYGRRRSGPDLSGAAATTVIDPAAVGSARRPVPASRVPCRARSRIALVRRGDAWPVRRTRRSLGADRLLARWRSGSVPDARHAQLVGMAVNLLRSLGWEVEVEVTYSSFGERGSIDILAWWPFARIALVVEIKSEPASVEATLRKLDEKVRLTIDSIADSVWRTAAGRRSIARPSGHHDRTASSQSRRRRTRRGSPGARHAPSSVAPTPEWADPRNLVRCRYQPGW